MAHIAGDGIVKAAGDYGWPSYSYGELADLRRKADRGSPVALAKMAELPLRERRLARYVLEAFIVKGKKKTRDKAVCLTCGALQNPDHDHCPECGEPLGADSPRAGEFQERVHRMSKKARRKALQAISRYERDHLAGGYVAKGWAPPTAHGRSCRCGQCTDPAMREAARKAGLG